MSDSDSGEENANAKPISDSAVQDTIPNLSGVDAERIRAQLGANTDSVRSFTRIYLFSSTKWPATAPTAAGFVVNTDAVFKTDDPVEKVFSANACTYRKFMQHALSSQWIKAQASVGWRLTQSVGDALLQEMCFEADSDLARCAWLTLRSFVDLRISTWKLRFEKFVFLLEKLQGRLWDKADESPENDEPSMCESHSSSTSSSLSVCVDVVIPRRLHTARSSSERVSYLMDIAALSLDLASIEDSCRVLTLHASSLLDHGNRTHRMHMQRSFACLLNRVSPASNWSLTCSGLVAELGRRFLHLQAQTQLGIVERLPTVNRRCMQVRRGLSFIFLRIHASCGLHADESIESLARTATLPSQIILRVVSELMEGSDQLFRVNASVDFAKLEAIIGLLSNILDSVQAMRDVRDVSRAIYQRLCVINQRISDGVADSIDKTLAKDAVQTLVVRLLMTAVSDSTEQRLSPVYNTSITLDSWINSS
ncbi:hypothetical protein EV174_003594 [Coemansia sp. RSA 2320]|nr:hypothetical protein EV174_003594 [Coemansia sp. RSA 2320]